MSMDPNYNEWPKCKHEDQETLKCANCGIRCCPQCSWTVDREDGEAIACGDCVTHDDLDADLNRIQAVKAKFRKVAA